MENIRRLFGTDGIRGLANRELTAGQALKRSGASVLTYNTSLTMENINDNCGSTHSEVLRGLGIKESANICFVNDGDGDRVIASDSKGNILDGDSVIAFCVLDMAKNGKLRNRTL